MKRLSYLLLSLFLVAFLLAGLTWFKAQSAPVASDTSLKDFLIVKGSSASQIANKLEKEGFIKNSLAFRIYVQLTGLSKKIPAGEYRLSPSYSLFRLVAELLKGPTEIWVTIPEGLRREEIAEKFTSAFGKGEDFSDRFLEAADGLEGFLFPDTYLFPKTASASAVVVKMRSTFDKKIAELDEKINSGSLTVGQVITLASIVERETKFAAERPIIAGILLNRLNLGMGLAADATVQYAIATSKCSGRTDCEWWPTLTKEDLSINSAYNTYRFKGLPPSPIANPGLSAIRAVVEPEESEYLYYLHDEKGVAHYARTLEEHNANVRKYLGQ
ncbi:MAG: endolytic transglycosylase MltG [Patescibacteria group bacterium]